MKVKTITHDCHGCPSSWSGLLEDGRRWRVRYRWGVMRLMVDADPNKLSVFSREQPEVLEERLGDELAGICDFEDVKRVYGHLLDFDSMEWVDEA